VEKVCISVDDIKRTEDRYNTLFRFLCLNKILMLIFVGDHALIDINKLLGLNPKQVTVRTKSRDSQSADSVPTPIPSTALKSKMNKV
jgi:hypothetical protein